jgi:hypothetical protein
VDEQGHFEFWFGESSLLWSCKLLIMSSTVELFSRGQRVLTSFGPGVVSAISYVDSILYVTLSEEPEPLYLLRPEQVEPLNADPQVQ